MALDLKYDPARHYYIRIATTELVDQDLPLVFVNVFRKKNFVECQTLDLLKLNQKITDSHHEVIQMSDASIQSLIDDIRADIAPLFKISEAVGLLDMLASFAQLVTTRDYCRPEITNALAIKSGRHPIREKIEKERYIPNDVYATRQSRFQIVTGCNMSGKSNYIRSIALMTILAQLGCFVPASYASFPVSHSLFARVSTDDSADDATTSTFAAEMRETAFILRNMDHRSLVIVDELGRGTSTRDGLCIAVAVAEALIDSGAIVWFVTHFRELPHILAERAGVVNLHLAVDMSRADTLKMLYRVSSGPCEDQYYGLALAKVAGLPEPVIKIAEYVSRRLAGDVERGRNKRSSKMAIALARKRKLVLGLHEQLIQAKEGKLEGPDLAMWMKALQDEFVTRMAAIEDDLIASGTDGEEEFDDGISTLDALVEDAENEYNSNTSTATQRGHSGHGTRDSAASIVNGNQDVEMRDSGILREQIEEIRHHGMSQQRPHQQIDAESVEGDEKDWWCVRVDRISKSRHRVAGHPQEDQFLMTGAIPTHEDMEMDAT